MSFVAILVPELVSCNHRAMAADFASLWGLTREINNLVIS